MQWQKCSGQMALALVIVVGFFAALFYLMSHEIPAGNRDLVNIVLGVLTGTGFGSVVGYYFGSSLGSRNKEQTITSTIQGMTPAPSGDIKIIADSTSFNVAKPPSSPAPTAPAAAPIVAAATAPQPSGAPSAP